MTAEPVLNSLCSFETSHRDGVSTVEVRGELDSYTTPDLAEVFTSLALDGRRQIVVDLGGVTFVDSTAMGVLVSGLKLFRSYGGDVRLRAAPPQLRKVSKLIGLEDVFTAG